MTNVFKSHFLAFFDNFFKSHFLAFFVAVRTNECHVRNFETKQDSENLT